MPTKHLCNNAFLIRIFINNYAANMPIAWLKGDIMIVHLVFFRWKKGTKNSDVEKIFSDIRALKKKCEGIIGLRCGKNFNNHAHDYTHGLVVSFKDKKSLSAYNSHPEHKKILRDIERIEEHVMVIDLVDHHQ